MHSRSGPGTCSWCWSSVWSHTAPATQASLSSTSIPSTAFQPLRSQTVEACCEKPCSVRASAVFTQDSGSFITHCGHVALPLVARYQRDISPHWDNDSLFLFFTWEVKSNHLQQKILCSPTAASRTWNHRSTFRCSSCSTCEGQKLENNGRMRCLALAEKSCQVSQLCCSSHKCLFCANVAPLKREMNKLSNDIWSL